MVRISFWVAWLYIFCFAGSWLMVPWAILYDIITIPSRFGWFQ